MQGQQQTFTVLPHRYVNSATVSFNRDQRDLDFLDNPQDITLVYYISDTMQTSLIQKEVASPLCATCIWKVGDSPATSVPFLEYSVV